MNYCICFKVKSTENGKNIIHAKQSYHAFSIPDFFTQLALKQHLAIQLLASESYRAGHNSMTKLWIVLVHISRISTFPLGALVRYLALLKVIGPCRNHFTSSWLRLSDAQCPVRMHPCQNEWVPYNVLSFSFTNFNTSLHSSSVKPKSSGEILCFRNSGCECKMITGHGDLGEGLVEF